MTSPRALAVATVAALALAGTAQAASAAGTPDGKQAAQCLTLYRLAGSAPENAAHKADFDKLQGLMGHVLDDNKVTQDQFGAWSGAFMKQVGTPQKPNGAFLTSSIQACNAFTKSKLQQYSTKPADKQP